MTNSSQFQYCQRKKQAIYALLLKQEVKKGYSLIAVILFKIINSVRIRYYIIGSWNAQPKLGIEVSNIMGSPNHNP